MSTLVGLKYSPWSERVRWVAAHHGVEHRYVEHQPVFGELGLRRKAGSVLRKATVPLWIDDDSSVGVLRDSLDIARRIDAIGGAEKLFPSHAEAEITAWNRRSEAALSAGRVLFFERLLGDPDARREAIPPFVPKPLHGLAMPTTKSAIRFMQRKYLAREGDAARLEAEIIEVLEALRAAVKGRATILESFSYADITAAVMLQMVEPVADRFIRLRPATRNVWRHPRFAERFGDLAAWRDALYEARRSPKK